MNSNNEFDLTSQHDIDQIAGDDMVTLSKVVKTRLPGDPLNASESGQAFVRLIGNENVLREYQNALKTATHIELVAGSLRGALESFDWKRAGVSLDKLRLHSWQLEKSLEPDQVDGEND